jgi:hypothetical protein
MGERALPFFKLLKSKGPIEWTAESHKSFDECIFEAYLPYVFCLYRDRILVFYSARTFYACLHKIPNYEGIDEYIIWSCLNFI